MPLAIKQLADANVYWFDNFFTSTIVMLCTLMCWMLTLFMYAANIAFGATVLREDGYDASTALLGLLLGTHIIVSLCMLLDSMYFNHSFWPLNTIIFCGHGYVVAGLSSVLGYSLTLTDDRRMDRVVLNALTLFVQVLYIAQSQAITLEYLKRRPSAAIAAAEC